LAQPVLLDEIIAGDLLQARAVYGFWPAHAEGDDIAIDGGPRFPMLRQQAARGDSRPNRCLADYIAPAGDHLGAFAVAVHGAEELARRHEDARDDYRAITVKALADRLAEACAEYVHLQARRAWFEPDAVLALGSNGDDPPSTSSAEQAPRTVITVEDLHAERFRGIRPAFGYPASPDHSEKAKLVDLLDAGRLGMGLTESFAMTPAASVSGLIFAHPRSRYFAVGRIGRDQVEDYAARKDTTVAEVERWLRPNLGYEPAGEPALSAPGA
jgi:5-methyltetrahydrofolate--homocysteine methyltransferase